MNRWIGLPVCLGIGPTKTLAKVANHIAKKQPQYNGVCVLLDASTWEPILANLLVEDVWGIGRKISKRLNMMGIKSALELAQADPRQIREAFSVVTERVVYELNGTSCLDLELVSDAKKQIISSRSFGDRITEYQPLKEAISEYVARACKKLRQEHQRSKTITVFIRTSAFAKNKPYYSNSATGMLAEASSDTRYFLNLSDKLLKSIWKSGFEYAKAGVMLSAFEDENAYQSNLFENMRPRHISDSLMSVMDQINAKGNKQVFFAGQGTQQSWQMKRGNLSPCYTTRWSDLPSVL